MCWVSSSVLISYACFNWELTVLGTQNLTDNVNLMAMNLTDQVCAITKVTKAVAVGEPTTKILGRFAWGDPRFERDSGQDDGIVEGVCG